MDPSKQVLLLVEDDPMMLKLYDRIFKMEGYVVELANGGEEGLQMARTSKP
jgi:DNA-binding response OmpR family regulator